MASAPKLGAKLASGMVGAASAAALGTFFLVSLLGQGLLQLSYDLPFALRPDRKVEGAVIVYMDEQSRLRLKQPAEGPWDRRLHTRLVKELARRHAQAVVFDVLFDQPSLVPSVDEGLAAAIQSHGGVVLAASAQDWSVQGNPAVSKILRAVDPIGSAAPWGIVELPLEPDGAIRRQFYHSTFTNLAWQASALIHKSPANRAAPRWLNYYASHGAIPRVSYCQVLEGDELPEQFFADKVVFVGRAPMIDYQGSKNVDVFRTPYTRWTGVTTAGVEIHAVAFLNLVRGDWLRRLPPAAEVGLVLLCGVLLGCGLRCLGPMAATGTGLVCFVFIPLVASYLVWQTHYWFPWAVVSGVQLPVALGCAIWPQSLRPLVAKEAMTLRGAEPPCVVQDLPGPPQESNSPDRAANGQSAQAAPASPPLIPDHSLLRCIGSGSYGQVWLARNILGTFRAVKIVYREHFESDAPFAREFAGIKNFEPISRSHDGFVDILQVGRNDSAGWFYYVMEVADDHLLGTQFEADSYAPKTLARDLATRLRIPVDECVRTGLGLLAALRQLHDKGLVHRDIKPSNIVYVDGVPKLADIGLVAELQEAKSYVGTSGFIPPEGPGTAQADIYSLGKVLYEISMGRDRNYFPELASNLGEGHEHELLLELNEVILKACAANPRRRYPSAQRMHQDLERLLPQKGCRRPRKTMNV